ncbi:hypothetical protein SLEP1_g31251 [Rubroshorea leprosula]|uniref:N-acetyl-gamma-glutamyl-phosphate reductase dimerisation domain-containing protein n=1 Tax=Rubroshorea leprosula TaxID=152421 RepID=A0AAV5KA65_9ROSI|nr:hypothetical protein SLEP1_g31251 [Rubroshorea leprosula]
MLVEGRGAKEANLYSEIAEGIYSYGVTRHRHVPEIEQGLSGAAHSKITLSFTPHLMLMLSQMAANENERLHKMAANEEGRAAQHSSSKVQQDRLQLLMK